MSEAGYTMVETLAALAIVALAISGLAAGVQLLMRQQDAVNALVGDTEALRAAQAVLERDLDAHAPFRSHEPHRLTGSRASMAFDCREAEPCRATLVDVSGRAAIQFDAHGRTRILPLRRSGPVEFRYEGALGSSARWPPERPERQALRGVTVVKGEGADALPLFRARIWAEQPVTCQFDPILQDCR